MKTVITTLACIATLVGCASSYSGPKSGQMVSQCYLEKRDLYLVGDCFEEKLTRHMPNWREQRDSYDVTAFTDFIRVKGMQVKDGIVSESDAYNEIMAYNSRMTNRARTEIAQERQARAATSATMIQAGTMLMTAPPTYAPPAQVLPYPSDTTINIQQAPAYRFYDSRPYR